MIRYFPAIHKHFKYQAKTLPVLMVILLFAAICGCGGNKIKGISERELTPINEPARVAINPRGYNHFVNGSILEAMGDYHMANEQYGKALSFYPLSNEIMYAYAGTFMNMRNFNMALNAAKNIHPRDARTWLLLANCFYALDIIDSSMHAFLKVVEYDTVNVQVYFQLASFYNDENDLDSAIWAYKNIARISSTAKAFSELGNLQTRAGYFDDAIINYNKSLTLDSSENNARTFVALALIYEDQGDSTKALENLEAAATRTPNDVFVMDKLLSYYQMYGDISKVADVTHKLIALVPQDDGIKRRLAMVYFEIDSLHLADSIFSHLLKENEDNIIDLYYSGRIAIIEEELDRAKGFFTKLTVLADSVVDGWLNLGWVYRLRDSTDLEIATYQKGLEYVRHPEDTSRLTYALAVSNERYGSVERSIELFESLISKRPDHGPALNYLGYMLADRGDRLEYALSLIEKALELTPENGAYIDSYGWVLFKMGEVDRALKELLRAYNYIDNDPVVADHIGDVYEALGDLFNAQVYWNKALELDPENKALKEKLQR
jgi:tetratricopeptide (TPR) repeat protein